MGTKFTGMAERALNRALHLAREMGHTYIGSEHVLLGLLAESDCIAAGVLDGGGVTYEAVRALVRKTAGVGEPTDISPSDMTPKTKKIIEDAARESSKGKSGFIGTEHLLFAILSEPECFAHKMICAVGASPVALKGEVSVFLGADPGRRGTKPKEEVPGAPTLSKYGRDFVRAAKEGAFDPVIGREAECARVMQILSRRTKNNPCLIGEPGVGKTAIVEGLAAMMAQGTVPDSLRDKTIISLDIPSMIAGAKYRGEFEERMKHAMEEVRRCSGIILFIDELHTIIGAGAAEGAVDAANILKPALSRGEIQLIGATTIEEYRRHIERDAALERRFQSVRVREATPAESVKILIGLRDRYEAHHKLKITDGAIVSAVELSSRYIKDRYLPDKAIDLMDETASRVRLENGGRPSEIKEIEEKIRFAGAEKKEAILSENYEGAMAVRDAERDLIREYRRKIASLEFCAAGQTRRIEAEDIAKTLEAWRGIPVDTTGARDEARLVDLEKNLLSVIKGQDEAVRAVCRAVRRGRVGIKDPERPSATFLFVGSSGVGKTALAIALAKALFDDGGGLIRFDMSEFSESHSVSKFIGSPPGYVGYGDGGRLTEAVRRDPYSIVLFDEIEKAHPDVLNVLLQIMENGRLTDALGRECDFKNTIIIMTSNIGGEKISDPRCLGFSANADNDHHLRSRRAEVEGELKKAFRPEFIGRIDEIAIFSPLGHGELSAIAECYLSESAERLAALGITAEFDGTVAESLASMTDPAKYGARPLRRLVTTRVDDALAEAILSGGIKRGDKVICTAGDDGVSFSVAGGKDAEVTVGA